MRLMDYSHTVLMAYQQTKNFIGPKYKYQQTDHVILRLKVTINNHKIKETFKDLARDS